MYSISFLMPSLASIMHSTSCYLASGLPLWYNLPSCNPRARWLIQLSMSPILLFLSIFLHNFLFRHSFTSLLNLEAFRPVVSTFVFRLQEAYPLNTYFSPYKISVITRCLTYPDKIWYMWSFFQHSKPYVCWKPLLKVLRNTSRGYCYAKETEFFL
jgi:hypothetical protein